jgi:phosphate-selective porin
MRLLSLSLLTALVAVRCAAAEPTVEERLKSLEQQVKQLAQENAGLKQQLGVKEPAAPVPVLVSPGGKELKLVLGGFLQAQAEFGRAADSRWAGVRDRFFFRRARIYAAGSLTADIDFKAELDLQGNTLSAGTGQLARANEIYIGWHKYPQASFRVGQLKPAFGSEQLASDTKVFTVERFQASDRLTDGRQLALSVAGESPGKRFTYLVVAANGNGANVSANDNSKFQKSARVTFVPLATKEQKLTFGANGLWTDDTGVAKAGLGFAGNSFTGHREAWGVDADWSCGALELSAELLHEHFAPVNAAAFDATGWHATAAYFVVPAKLMAVVRHEAFDPTTTLGGNTATSWTFSLNYFLRGDDVKLMLDYVVGKVPGAADDGGRLLTRMQVVF